LGQSGILEILKKFKVIAVVGLSKNEYKPSYEVAIYMKGQGHLTIPVNQFADEVFDKKSYKCQLDIYSQKRRRS
jgi:predicted CoA-binding protein